jgi:hypothetical protein
MRLFWRSTGKRALNRPCVRAAVDFDANFNENYSLQRKLRLRAKLKDYLHVSHECVETLDHDQRETVTCHSTTSVLARYAACLFPAHFLPQITKGILVSTAMLSVFLSV